MTTYINTSQAANSPESIFWLEKSHSGRVSVEDIKDALEEFERLFNAGISTKAETLTLHRAFPNNVIYTEAASKLQDEDDSEPLVIGGPASVELIDREGHLITTQALTKAFEKFMSNFRTRNTMVLHSDVQVGWALPAYISKGGQIFISGVDDKGLFFICELRGDTAIAKKVEDQISKGLLKSYSIAGSATKIQNMQKGQTPYMQVDEMELAEVTVCEKGVNQGASFEILKAEMPQTGKIDKDQCGYRDATSVENNIGINCGHCKYYNSEDRTCDVVVGDIMPNDYCKLFEACEEAQPHKESIMILRSEDNQEVDFTNSFINWFSKESKKDPLTSGESFATLNNIAGRESEHHQLLREYGFPSEVPMDSMRYVPVFEVETDDKGIPLHNLPPWVVNEAGESLGDRLDEDAPTHKSTVQKMGELFKAEPPANTREQRDKMDNLVEAKLLDDQARHDEDMARGNKTFHPSSNIVARQRNLDIGGASTDKVSSQAWPIPQREVVDRDGGTGFTTHNAPTDYSLIAERLESGTAKTPKAFRGQGGEQQHDTQAPYGKTPVQKMGELFLDKDDDYIRTTTPRGKETGKRSEANLPWSSGAYGASSPVTQPDTGMATTDDTEVPATPAPPPTEESNWREDVSDIPTGSRHEGEIPTASERSYEARGYDTPWNLSDEEMEDMGMSPEEIIRHKTHERNKAERRVIQNSVWRLFKENGEQPSPPSKKRESVIDRLKRAGSYATSQKFDRNVNRQIGRGVGAVRDIAAGAASAFPKNRLRGDVSSRQSVVSRQQELGNLDPADDPKPWRRMGERGQRRGQQLAGSATNLFLGPDNRGTVAARSRTDELRNYDYQKKERLGFYNHTPSGHEGKSPARIHNEVNSLVGSINNQESLSPKQWMEVLHHVSRDNNTGQRIAKFHSIDMKEPEWNEPVDFNTMKGHFDTGKIAVEHKNSTHQNTFDTMLDRIGSAASGAEGFKPLTLEPSKAVKSNIKPMIKAPTADFYKSIDIFNNIMKKGVLGSLARVAAGEAAKTIGQKTGEAVGDKVSQKINPLILPAHQPKVPPQNVEKLLPMLAQMTMRGLSSGGAKGMAARGTASSAARGAADSKDTRGSNEQST